MTPPKVQELTGWQATAAELRRIALRLDAVPGDLTPHTSLTIVADSAEAVDQAGVMLFDMRGETREVGVGWQRTVEGYFRGRVRVCVLAMVAPPTDPRDAEIARLRAENAGLRGRPT